MVVRHAEKQLEFDVGGFRSEMLGMGDGGGDAADVVAGDGGAKKVAIFDEECRRRIRSWRRYRLFR